MKHLSIICLLVALSNLTIAQREVDEDTPQKLKDRMYFGGGFGLNAGQLNGIGYFDISLSPIIGYMITPQLSAGTGISWQRTSYDTSPSIVLNQWGISPFVRYNFNQQLFSMAEYNFVSTPILAFNSQGRYVTGATRTFTRLLLGIGYSQPLGSRGAINAVGLYDVSYNRNDLAFASPWVFRVFFTF
jgi:hypothetical protein